MRERALRDCRSEAETHWHGKDDGHQRLQDGVSEDERWSLIKMVNLQVNRLQDGCSGDEMRAAWATSSESSNGNSEKQRNELAAAAHGKTGRPAQELNHVNLVHESSRSEKPQAESTLPITCGVTRLAVREQQLSHLPTPSWSQQQTQCLQRRPPR